MKVRLGEHLGDLGMAMQIDIDEDDRITVLTDDGKTHDVTELFD